MSDLVSISGVRKGYGAKKKVFENLNLTIESGKIIGILGPNGSGKTTLIKMLAGLLTAESGSILIDGMEVGPKTKSVVAYLPERTYFDENLKVKNVINTFKDFYTDFDGLREYHMLEMLSIDPETVIKKLSKGNKEKVQLIMVMSRRAKLYLLDEPIAGVDPAARDYILHTIISNFEPTASIIISTHLIQDVENVLDDIIFIKTGEIVCHKDADTLRKERGMSVDEIFREVFRCW